jgi:non-ribosomal peptide synthetase component E (peptide arylation enzyme)
MASFLAGVPARRAALEDRHRPWRSRTVSALLDSVVTDYPDRPFVITEHGTLSYAELAGRAARLARGLVASGVLSTTASPTSRASLLSCSSRAR